MLDVRCLITHHFVELLNRWFVGCLVTHYASRITLLNCWTVESLNRWIVALRLRSVWQICLVVWWLAETDRSSLRTGQALSLRNTLINNILGWSSPAYTGVYNQDTINHITHQQRRASWHVVTRMVTRLNVLKQPGKSQTRWNMYCAKTDHGLTGK